MLLYNKLKSCVMIRIVLFIAFLLSTQSISAQGSQVEFGKNRVQYHQDFEEWSQYESQNFINLYSFFFLLFGHSSHLLLLHGHFHSTGGLVIRTEELKVPLAMHPSHALRLEFPSTLPKRALLC